jgi:predicted  nucleic acid-binding Zn-ribbon protein
MATLVQQVEDLKKENKGLKMTVTKQAKKINGTSTGKALASGKRVLVLEGEVEKLKGELDASRRECGQLVKSADGLENQVSFLERQCYHMQQLVFHTAAVSVWKVLEDGESPR